LLWIHHSAGAYAPSAEEVAGAAGRGVEELAEDHGSASCPWRGLLPLDSAWIDISANTVFLSDR
jgi:hypothetical protein